MEITKLNQAGINLIKKFEGCILHPYHDKAGIPTIGYGQTYYPKTGKKVTMQDAPVSQAEADAMLLEMVKPYELAVYAATRHNITQNNFNALVSLTYNIGNSGFKRSTVCRLVNQNITGEPLKAAFMLWDKADGKVLDDLVNRRRLEYQTYIAA